MKKNKFPRTKFTSAALILAMSLQLFSLGTGTAFAGGDEQQIEDCDGCAPQVTVVPIPVLSYDRGRQIIRQGDHDYSQTQPQQQQQGASAGPAYVLQTGDASGKHMVVDSRSLLVGLGVGAKISFKCASGFGIGGALIPMYNGASSSKRIVDSYETAKDISYIRVPKKADDLDSWKAGDTLTYSSKGTLKLLVGAGYYGIIAGGTASVSGKWGHTVTKLADNKVKVTISKQKILDSSLFAGVILVARGSLAVEKIFDKDITFILDLNDAKAREIYEELMKGQMGKAQEIAKQDNGKAVVLQETNKSNETTKSVSGHIGIPYIVSKDKSHGKTVKLKQTVVHPDQKSTDAQITVIDTTNSFRHINNPFKKSTWTSKTYRHQKSHELSQAVAYSTVEKDLENDGQKVSRGSSLEVVWSFRDDKAKSNAATSYIEKIKSESGMGDALNVQFPQGHLGFVGVEFKVNVDNNGIEALKQSIKQNREYLVDSGNKFVDGYFQAVRNGQVPENTKCVDNAGTLDDKCIEKVKKSVASDMKKATKEMDKAVSTDVHDSKRSSKLSQVAAIVRSNPFTFKAFLSAVPGASADYTVEGEKFLAVKKKLVFGDK